MKKKLALFFVAAVILLLISFFIVSSDSSQGKTMTFWEVASIDTMKYSRDPSREKVTDPLFDNVIDMQVKSIADTGATHVSIGTPYDEEFLPILKRWVFHARKYGLKVWFRGNWSGWEKWFGYSPIDRKTHIEKTRKFILENKALFEDGDIFTTCPECENGGPGDPRRNGDIKGHRQFLIDEYNATQQVFVKIGKKVASNYNSMNGDVALLIMDKETTQKLDGIVVIDHYVASPQKLVFDIDQLVKQSDGKIILGEFGAPIPDIHGKMSEKEQREWLEVTLKAIVENEHVVGLNYWTSFGGSTELWGDKGQAKKAVSTIEKFYSPIILSGLVKNALEENISSALVIGEFRKTKTDKNGEFSLPSILSSERVGISADGYKTKEVMLEKNKEISVALEKEREDIFFKIKRLLKRIFPASSIYHLI